MYIAEMRVVLVSLVVCMLCVLLTGSRSVDVFFNCIQEMRRGEVEGMIVLVVASGRLVTSLLMKLLQHCSHYM